MGDLYRAEARREHSGRATQWRGKWRKDPKRAIQQAIRWREREPTAEIYLASTNGMKASLEELLTAQKSGKPR